MFFEKTGDRKRADLGKIKVNTLRFIKIREAMPYFKANKPEWGLTNPTGSAPMKIKPIKPVRCRAKMNAKNMDQRIMALLVDNPRMSLTMISMKTGMPISTVYERIKQIEKRYVFKGTFTRRCKE